MGPLYRANGCHQPCSRRAGETILLKQHWGIVKMQAVKVSLLSGQGSANSQWITSLETHSQKQKPTKQGPKRLGEFTD